MAAKRKSGGKGKKSAKDGGGVSPLVWAGMAVVAAVVLSVVFSGSNMGEKQPKGKKNRRMAKPPPPPQPTTGIFDESIPFADPNLAQEGPHRALKSDLLQRWNPVAINHTRQLILDPSGKVYNLTTIAMEPPIFEMENFLLPEECAHLQTMAGDSLYQSDSTYLDGSTKKTAKELYEPAESKKMGKEEANTLFRYSDQTWLEHDRDPLMQNMMDRVMNLGLLPPQVRKLSEQMQVVRYSDNGHYESHWDSEKTNLGPCCADPVSLKKGMRTGVEALSNGMGLEGRCRLCRFMTVLYVLDDTEEGGGTVFPLADTTDEELAEWQTSTDPLKYKQTRACAPGKIVMPKRGKAIMWYNHHIDRGHLGDLDQRSLHGGCNVDKGTKWISNHWMTALPHPDVPRKAATAHY